MFLCKLFCDLDLAFLDGVILFTGHWSIYPRHQMHELQTLIESFLFANIFAEVFSVKLLELADMFDRETHTVLFRVEAVLERLDRVKECACFQLKAVGKVLICRIVDTVGATENEQCFTWVAFLDL